MKTVTRFFFFFLTKRPRDFGKKKKTDAHSTFPAIDHMLMSNAESDLKFLNITHKKINSGSQVEHLLIKAVQPS